MPNLSQYLDVSDAFGPLMLTSSLDMWIADGGAASQLFALDTQVNTPIITGDNLVNDPGLGITFGISNLDSDVVSILVGPSTVGVLSIYGFVNNGDGTGTFQVNFDSNVPSRQLTIVARDDVDNDSSESPIFIVNSIQQVKFSDNLTIAPQQLVSDDTCQSLLDNVPSTSFIQKKQYTVPYSFNTTTFELRAITPSSPVEITVVRRGLAGDPLETQTYTVIPSKEVELVELRLCKGANVVSVADEFGNSFQIIVAATTYMSVLCAYAREIYNYSQVLIDEQESLIFSPVSSRIAEPLLQFNDLLPDVRAQQVLATKLAVRSLVSGAGRQIGVRDIIAALSLSTPIFKATESHNELFEPSIIPLYNSQESFGGVEAHVWLANECVRRWLAFLRFLQNFDAFRIVDISENAVVFYDDNGDLQTHYFDFSDGKCSLTDLALRSTCFESIDINIAIFSESSIVICAPAYPFDMVPTPDDPIYPLYDEAGEGGLDPGFDGYFDFNITNHWDGGVPLDSMGPMPALGSSDPVCVYENGHLVSPLLLGSVDADVDAEVEVEVEATSSPAVGASLDVSIDLAGSTVTSDLDLYIKLPQAEVSLDVSILSVETVEAGMSVAITA